jgi:hypothetical protein
VFYFLFVAGDVAERVFGFPAAEAVGFDSTALQQKFQEAVDQKKARGCVRLGDNGSC